MLMSVAGLFNPGCHGNLLQDGSWAVVPCVREPERHVSKEGHGHWRRVAVRKMQHVLPVPALPVLSSVALNQRYMMSMTVADPTGQTWISTFNDDAAKLLGCTADEMYLIKESDEAEYQRRFDSVLFQQYTIKCRAKQEVYQDEAKMRITASGISKMNFAERGRELCNLIAQMEA